MKKKFVQCRDVFEHICNNLDVKLDSPECRAIKRHIERCPNCVAYLDGLKKTILLYREYPNPTVPAKVHRQLFAVLKLPNPRRKKK